MKQSDKLFAVWKYDLFPYLLGGEVSYFNENGNPYISAYQGAFKTTCLLPLKKGKQFKAKVDDISSRRKHEMDEVGKRYQKELDDLKKEYNVKI